MRAPQFLTRRSAERRRGSCALLGAALALGSGLAAAPATVAAAMTPTRTAPTSTTPTRTTPTRTTAPAVAGAHGAVHAVPAAPSDRNRTIRPGRPASGPIILRLFHRYELVNTASRLRADVMWASTDPLTGVFLWPDNDSRSQEFSKLDTDDGWFRLRARHSGQCLMLDWREGHYRNGTKVLQHPYCGDDYEPAQWQFRTLSDYTKPCTQGPPYYCGFRPTATVLVNRRTGRCLDAENGRLGTPPERAVLQQWDCSRYVDDPKIGNQGWGLLDLDAPPPTPPR